MVAHKVSVLLNPVGERGRRDLQPLLLLDYAARLLQRKPQIVITHRVNDDADGIMFPLHRRGRERAQARTAQIQLRPLALLLPPSAPDGVGGGAIDTRDLFIHKGT